MSKSVVHKILTDFFAALIELSRKTQSEVILDFKLGNLHLFKNGELFFEAKSETDSLLKDPKSHKNEVRDDVSIIDNVSAILS